VVFIWRECFSLDVLFDEVMLFFVVRVVRKDFYSHEQSFNLAWIFAGE